MPEERSPILRAAYRHEWAEVERLLATRGAHDIFEAAAAGALERVDAFVAQDPAAVRGRTADGFTALHLAAYFGRERIVGLLLREGAGVDAVAENPTQVRPLHSAVAGRHHGCVRLLLEAGAQPDAQQAGGFTALMAAVNHGDDLIVDLLLEAGADPGIRADDGRTANDFAAGGAAG